MTDDRSRRHQEAEEYKLAHHATTLRRRHASLPHGAQIDLAGSERRNRVDEAEVVALRQPEPRQIGQAQPLPEMPAGCDRRVGVEGDEALAARVVGHRGDAHEYCGVEERLDLLLDLHVRHHLAADLAEARQPIGDPDEARLVDARDVAGRRTSRRAAPPRCAPDRQVALHAVRAVDEQQPVAADERSFAGFGIDDLGDDAGQRMADGAGLRAALRARRRRSTSGALTATTGDISVQP